jgi:hypothetical protein
MREPSASLSWMEVTGFPLSAPSQAMLVAVTALCVAAAALVEGPEAPSAKVQSKQMTESGIA